jgi:uncharacterized membrane protein affecting hemolysin expression
MKGIEMAKTDFLKVLEFVVSAMKEARKLYRDPQLSEDTRLRAVGLSICLSHLMDMNEMKSPMILDKLANNLQFMKAEIQKEEENSITKSIPKSIMQEGGKLLH